MIKKYYNLSTERLHFITSFVLDFGFWMAFLYPIVYILGFLLLEYLQILRLFLVNLRRICYDFSDSIIFFDIGRERDVRQLADNNYLNRVANGFPKTGRGNNRF